MAIGVPDKHDRGKQDSEHHPRNDLDAHGRPLMKVA
jgi:hypothetical protein